MRSARDIQVDALIFLGLLSPPGLSLFSRPRDIFGCLSPSQNFLKEGLLLLLFALTGFEYFGENTSVRGVWQPPLLQVVDGSSNCTDVLRISKRAYVEVIEVFGW